MAKLSLMHFGVLHGVFFAHAVRIEKDELEVVEGLIGETVRIDNKVSAAVERVADLNSEEHERPSMGSVGSSGGGTGQQFIKLDSLRARYAKNNYMQDVNGKCADSKYPTLTQWQHFNQQRIAANQEWQQEGGPQNLEEWHDRMREVYAQEEPYFPLLGTGFENLFTDHLEFVHAIFIVGNIMSNPFKVSQFTCPAREVEIKLPAGMPYHKGTLSVRCWHMYDAGESAASFTTMHGEASALVALRPAVPNQPLHGRSLLHETVLSMVGRVKYSSITDDFAHQVKLPIAAGCKTKDTSELKTWRCQLQAHQAIYAQADQLFSRKPVDDPVDGKSLFEEAKAWAIDAMMTKCQYQIARVVWFGGASQGGAMANVMALMFKLWLTGYENENRGNLTCPGTVEVRVLAFNTFRVFDETTKLIFEHMFKGKHLQLTFGDYKPAHINQTVDENTLLRGIHLDPIMAIPSSETFKTLSPNVVLLMKTGDVVPCNDRVGQWGCPITIGEKLDNQGTRVTTNDGSNWNPKGWTWTVNIKPNHDDMKYHMGGTVRGALHCMAYNMGKRQNPEEASVPEEPDPNLVSRSGIMKGPTKI